LKLIRQWLKAGVMEDGTVRETLAGTPQGGVISPLLAISTPSDPHFAAQSRVRESAPAIPGARS